ncbi:RING-type E3 ubiquitin transferase [Ranunculus cassubicifolius]
MTKFSLEGDEVDTEQEEEEGSSSTPMPPRKQKKMKSRDEEHNNPIPKRIRPSEDESITKDNDEIGVSITLSDTEVLDCSICMEPLSPPVFQCENGHIACSTCCTKLANKCPSCSWPIGYNRCLAIEKVIESVKVSCCYKTYGCPDTFSYSQKLTHEEQCTHAPCTCPISDCTFCGSSKQLSLHFSTKHWSSAKRVRYNCPVTVSLGKLDSYLVFQAEEDDHLFILNNQIELIGSAINVSCISGRLGGGLLYDIIVRKGSSSLRLQSQTKCVKDRAEIADSSSLGEFLLVPYEFYDDSRDLKLEICIWK